MRILFLFLFLSSSFAVRSQSISNGIIENQQIIFSKNKQINFEFADRSFLNFKSNNDSANSKQYMFVKNYTPAIIFIASYKHKISKVDHQPPTNFNNNFISIGVGNYLSTYACLNYYLRKNEKSEYSVNIIHDAAASGVKKWSSYGKNSLNLNASYKINNSLLFSELYVSQDKRFFYGATEIYDQKYSAKQNIINEKFLLSLKPFSGKYLYTSLTLIPFNTSSFNLKETGLEFLPYIKYHKDSKVNFGLSTDFRYSKFANKTSEITRFSYSSEAFSEIVFNYFKIIPKLQIAYLKDNKLSNFRLYPGVVLHYELLTNLKLRGEVSSTFQQNSLGKELTINPWLADSSQISYLHIPFYTQLSLSYNLAKVSFKANYNHQTQSKFLVYNTNPKDSSRFLSKVSDNNISKDIVEISVIFKPTSLIIFGGDIYYTNYSNVNNFRLPYYSKVNAHLYTTYFTNILSITAGLNIKSSQTYLRLNGTEGNVGSFYDGYLLGSYSISKRFDIWTRIDNLFNNKPEMYYLYQVNGTRLLFGLTLNF